MVDNDLKNARVVSLKDFTAKFVNCYCRTCQLMTVKFLWKLRLMAPPVLKKVAAYQVQAQVGQHRWERVRVRRMQLANLTVYLSESSVLCRFSQTWFAWICWLLNPILTLTSDLANLKSIAISSYTFWENALNTSNPRILGYLPACPGILNCFCMVAFWPCFKYLCIDVQNHLEVRCSTCHFVQSIYIFIYYEHFYTHKVAQKCESEAQLISRQMKSN